MNNDFEVLEHIITKIFQQTIPIDNVIESHRIYEGIMKNEDLRFLLSNIIPCTDSSLPLTLTDKGRHSSLKVVDCKNHHGNNFS